MSEVKIMEYNGKYRIEEGRTKDDKWYAEKCMKQSWNEEKRTKEFSDKVGNLSIKLGDKVTAETTLLQLLQELTGDEYVVKMPQGEPVVPNYPTERDIPF